MSDADDKHVLERRALIAAIVFGIAGFGLLETYERRLVREISGGAPVAVLVAKRDIARGTELTKEVLGVRDIPENYVEPRQIRHTALKDVLGAKLGVALKAGEVLSATDMDARARSKQLSDLVEPGTRALTVTTSAPTALLRPGDRVDVLERHSGSVPLLQNLLVLAVGEEMGEERKPTSTGDGVTLGAPPEEILELSRASTRGPISLAIRNPTDKRKLSAVMPPTEGAESVSARPRDIEHVR